MPRITIEEYSTEWPERFEILKAKLWPLVSDLATGIEHVGSTAVEGLAAKPIIDIDIIINSEFRLPEVRRQLVAAGYEFEGDRGITQRFAFRCREPEFPHNLYVCVAGTLALENHIILRDHLRNNDEDRLFYGELKRDLARKYPNDIVSYIRGKTAFIIDILSEYDIDEEELDFIESQN